MTSAESAFCLPGRQAGRHDRGRSDHLAWAERPVQVLRVLPGPGSSPAQLAMVTVLQFAENLTDRQAADAVRVGRDDRVGGCWPWSLGGRSGLASCRHQPQYERSEDQLHCQLHLPARHDDDVRP